MAEKTLAVIGASEETVAHIRLLIKLGARQLEHQWRWGDADAADFVAVEVHDLGAQGMIARCQAAGVPCALMAEADEVVVHGLVLRRPFKMDQIVAVLNAAGKATADSGPVESFSDDFYTRELDEIDAPTDGSRSNDLWTKREHAPLVPRLADVKPAEDLDFLIHGDPLIEPEKPRPLILPDTDLERTSGSPTQRSMSRAEQSRHRVMPPGVVGVGPVDVAPIAMPPRNEFGAPLPAMPARGEASEPAGYRLADLLDGDLIASPTQLQIPDLPALTLDTKSRAFHADADLAQLDPYTRTVVPRTAWKGLSSAELARVRDAQPARSYDELRWLMALSTSGGRLAARLDPGGTFHVSKPLRIDPSFHAHGAISAALATPARLHEITATSGATMEQVFDVVNAYDAIGRLTWTPRQRFATEPAADKSPAGALSRLKWPFGKR
jgi:hypothetical protein